MALFLQSHPPPISSSSYPSSSSSSSSSSSPPPLDHGDDIEKAKRAQAQAESEPLRRRHVASITAAHAAYVFWLFLLMSSFLSSFFSATFLLVFLVMMM